MTRMVGIRGRGRHRRPRARNREEHGPGRLRSRAIARAKTRMNTSAIRKIFTFVQNAERMSGKASSNSCRLKNASLTSSHPPSGRRRARRCRRRPPSRRARLRRSGRRRSSSGRRGSRTRFSSRSCYFRIGAPSSPASEPRASWRPVLRIALIALFTQRTSGLPFWKTSPKCSFGPGSGAVRRPSSPGSGRSSHTPCSGSREPCRRSASSWWRSRRR